MDLSVIIVNFNTKTLTEQAVNSVLRTAKRSSVEVIVADNSTDEGNKYKNNGYSENVKAFSIENKGFGNACNLAVQKACGDYLLFLNSDTVVFENAIDDCVDFIKRHKSIGIVGARLILSDGSLDHGCKRGFPTPMTSLFYFFRLHRLFPKSRYFGGYTKSYVGERAVCEVDSVSGGFLMLRAELFRRLCGFDERFFMYGEDIDLCYRAKKIGERVVYYGKAAVLHLKGQSGLHTRSIPVIKHFYASMRLFYNKHYRKKYGAAVSLFVMAAIRLKCCIAVIRARKKPH